MRFLCETAATTGEVGSGDDCGPEIRIHSWQVIVSMVHHTGFDRANSL